MLARQVSHMMWQIRSDLRLPVSALAYLPPPAVWLPQVRKLVHPLEARPGVTLPRASRTCRQSTKGLNSSQRSFTSANTVWCHLQQPCTARQSMLAPCSAASALMPNAEPRHMHACVREASMLSPSCCKACAGRMQSAHRKLVPDLPFALHL